MYKRQVSTPEGNPVVDANITVLDEYKIPHATVITDKNGYYSITVPAGNLTLAASLGTPQADVEIIRKTSNNLLMTKDGIIISEEQATRQTAHEVNIDLIVEPATVSGKIYWDYGGDDSFDSEDDALPLIEVKVENVKSGVELYSTTDFAGDYHFDGLAPGEYEITATVEGHPLELKSYKGQASIKANQDLTVDASLKPASVWGKFSDAGLGTQTITVSLEDQTNSSVIQQSFLSSTHSSSKCYTDLVSYCFSNLLPGKYKVSMTSNDVFTGWTNNTIELEIGEGESKSYNGSLAEGFRIEGILAHNGNPITNQQLSINNVNGQYGDNILTAENGYFTTVVPRGIYNLYTVNENNQTTLAYLGLVDTDTKPELINANMDSAFVLKGVLFNDINGNGKYEPEKEENGYPDFKIEFDSGHGTTSVCLLYTSDAADE